MRHLRYPELWRGCVGAWCPSQDKSRTAIVTDFSGSGNHGTLKTQSGTIDPASQYSANMLVLRGSYDYIDCGVNLDNNGPITITAWIRPVSVAAGFQSVVSNCNSGGTQQDYHLEINNTAGKLGWLQAGSRSPTGSISLIANRWQHVAATRTGTTSSWTVTLFVDGVIDASAVNTSNPNASGTRCSIGRLGDYTSAFYFNGSINDVRMYNRWLDPSEIKTLAKYQAIAFETVRNRRSHRVAGPTFKAAWLNQRSQIIGGGVR